MSNVLSPFKFLNSYQRDDADIYFGRQRETELLYEAISGVKHLLVYGPSGSGKTSLIECGLRNRFSDADWYALGIRRGNNMNASVFGRINEVLRRKIELDPDTGLPADPDVHLGTAVESLFDERYKPVYLLFDQFEELLISGSDEEKKEFFSRLNGLVRYKVPCRVIIVMREEFIGHLSEFEPYCPTIFQHRFRVEKMRKDDVKMVIRETLEADRFRGSFEVKDSALLADSILGKLPDKSREIELAHVQVFLSELWDRAVKKSGGSGLPLLGEELIDTDDDLAGVLESFLKKQLGELDKIYGENMALETLSAMITERQTKLQVSQEELQRDLESKNIVPGGSQLSGLLLELENRRILRTLKSGEQTQYEISHDVLALAVGKNRTREMELRARAAEVYKLYEDRENWFSQDEIDFLRPFSIYREYPPRLGQLVRDSEDKIMETKEAELNEARENEERERQLREKSDASRRRATLFARGAGLLATLALLLAIYAYYQQKEANQAKLKADSSALVASEQRDIARIEKLKADSSAVLAFEQKQLAEQKSREAEINLGIAKREEARALVALEQVKKEKNATEEQRRRAEDNYRVAQEKTLEAERQAAVANKALDDVRSAISEVIRLNIRESDALIKRLEYKGAEEKLRKAANLTGRSEELSDALLELVFWYCETDSLSLSADLLMLADSLTAGVLPAAVEPVRSAILEGIGQLDGAVYKRLQARYYPVMVFIEGGSFDMGSQESDSYSGDDERPVHRVTLSSFEMSSTEVTWWQYYLFCVASGYEEAERPAGWGGEGDNPVVNVSWYDAVAYSNWLSERRGKRVMYSIDKLNTDPKNLNDFDYVKWTVNLNAGSVGYRLPTDSEWEYAARGGNRSKGTVYAGGDSLALVGWYYENSGSRTRAVGEKVANELGLYDMSGNVWEWCWDWCWDWYNSYPTDEQVNPLGAEMGEYRVFRGGGWDGEPRHCRAANRNGNEPTNRYNYLGFRLASSLQ